MIRTILFPVSILLSALFVVAASGRSKNKRNKILMLIAGDILCVVSEFMFPYEKNIAMFIPALVVGILNLFALGKIFGAENPNQEMYNAWHDDPANWKAGIFYYNPLDKRLFPPKRIEAGGWTVNFANPFSVIVLLGILLLTIIIVYVAAIYKSK
jgi:uncharacterized membrane protein